MLAIMCKELQREHENTLTASEILSNLQKLYGEQNRTARHEMSEQLFMLKMLEELNVENDLLNLIELSHYSQLDLIQQSLPNYFYKTIVDFHMNKLECTLTKLLKLLVMA